MLVDLWIGIIITFNAGTGLIEQFITIPAPDEQSCQSQVISKLNFIPNVDQNTRVFINCHSKEFNIEQFIDESI